jgi:S-adenosyl methyltransferase
LVRYLSLAGIRQFLDIGSGIPAQGNVREAAQRANPDARIVYADIDPGAIAHSKPFWLVRTMLRSSIQICASQSGSSAIP